MNDKDIVLLLDYGGVLGYDHLMPQEEQLAHTLGLTQAELNNRISEKSEIGQSFRENKIPELDFWKTISGNNDIDTEFAHRLTCMWMDTYALNETMMSYLQQLRQKIKVGVLTNIDIARSTLLKDILNADINLDYYFPSYSLGYSKDTPQLWNLVDESLRQYNDKMVIVIYVDDRAEHVLSAERIGWKGIRYYTLDQLIKQIDLLIINS